MDRAEVVAEIARLTRRRRKRLGRAQATAIALNEAFARPDRGTFPANDPEATLDAVLAPIAALAGEATPPPFTLQSDPREIVRWVLRCDTLRSAQVARQTEERLLSVQPYLPRQVRARINELPYGHARDAFSALETLRALFGPNHGAV